MRPLLIEESGSSPRIELDQEKGIFQITGKSFPEDVKTFYIPVIEWIQEYVKAPNSGTVFEVALEYFNTASSKMLLVVLSQLKEIQKNGKTVKVIWSYPENDLEIEDAGIEFSEVINIPFTIKKLADSNNK